jgi:hypothetical protein
MENLQKQRLSKIIMELVWWLVTAIAAFITVQPLWGYFQRYDFIYELILYIIVFITFARYVFFLKYTFLAHFQMMKFVLIFLSLPLIFYMVQEFFEFQDFLERQNSGLQEAQIYFKEGLGFQDRYGILAYLSKMYTFFAVAAIITVVITPFRMLKSYWRVYNKTGTV